MISRIDDILTSIAVGYTFLIGIVRIEIFDFSLRQIFENTFFIIGGVASTIFVILRTMNEYKKFKNDKENDRI